MLLERRLRSNLSDEGAPPGVLWNIFYFEICSGLSTEKLIWVISCTLSVVTGFPACVLILRKMWQPRQSGTPLTPNSLFILHLTIMDTIFLTTIPLGILNNMIFKVLELESVLNGLYSLNVCGRPLMMTCMCLDCYVAVLHPITYHQKKSLTPRIVMICFVWFCSFGIGVIFFLSPQYSGLISMGPFIITTVIVGISDSFILHALFKSDAGKKNIHQQKKRAVQSLINSLVMTILFYFPPILMEMLRMGTIGSNSFLCTSMFLATALSTLGSGVMPILYFLNRKKHGGCKFVCSLLNLFNWRCRKTANFHL